jgi:hypothetical protein
MSWITIIIQILANLPTIIKIVREILDLLGKIRDKRERKLELNVLQSNLNHGKKTKNFSRLEEQLKRLKKRCEED